jgi:ABC-type glycerol-3-phosphate transport system substrate-binding protein
MNKTMKKVFALVMVVGVLGAFLGGCAPAEEAKPAETTTGTTATPETK